MKNTKKIFALIVATFLLVGGLIFTSCKKGDTGPAGPQGAAGTNGVANVQSSTVTTNNSGWTYDATQKNYWTQITWAAITQAVLDKGTVQVFIASTDGTAWFALPFSYGNQQYYFSYQVGAVQIKYQLSDSSTPSNPGGQTYKVVVIPPAAKSSQQNPDVNNERVEQIFKIEG